jgi:hypothetical protein
VEQRLAAVRADRAKYGVKNVCGFPALGPADGPTKRAIFGENSARLYRYDAKRWAELATDRITLAQADYERQGPGRTNIRYGFVPMSVT